jgi:DNA-binding beta-propeller fold protein YncE
MRLEKHRLLVGVVIAVLFTAVGGSVQAAAQTPPISRTAGRTAIPPQLQAWMAMRHSGASGTEEQAAQRTDGAGDRGVILTQVGGDPSLGAVDPDTHTAYVPNFDSNSVSVINDRTCSTWC